MTMSIRVNTKAVQVALDNLDPKANKSAILTGERAGAKYLKAMVKAAVPSQMKRMVRAVYQGTAKRDKPGAFVAIRGGKKGAAAATNRAFYRHWVIGGTQQRTTKSGANRGRMTANPIIARVADANGNHAIDIAMDAITKALGL